MYSAKVTETSSGQAETYTGLTKRPFKTRWKEHLRDFEKSENRTSTKLSGHIWDLKDKGLSYNLEWSLIDKAPPFNNSTKVCQLCLKEKYHIMYNREDKLNKRSEIFSRCRHMDQKRLQNLGWFFLKFHPYLIIVMPNLLLLSFCSFWYVIVTLFFRFLSVICSSWQL